MRILIFLIPLALGCATGQPETSAVLDAELVYTPVSHDQSDIYLLVENSNDIPIYVPAGISHSKTTLNGRTSFGCGAALVFPEDFIVLTPGEKRIFTLWRRCQLDKGVNTIHVDFGRMAVPDHRDGRVVFWDFPVQEITIINDQLSTSN